MNLSLNKCLFQNVLKYSTVIRQLLQEQKVLIVHCVRKVISRSQYGCLVPEIKNNLEVCVAVFITQTNFIKFKVDLL